MMELLIPLLFLLAGSFAIARRQDVYAALLTGAQRGLRLLATLAPTLIVLLSVVTFLRQSGFFELLSTWLRPLFSRLGIPAELAPLMLIRPLSGSAALAIGADLPSCSAARKPRSIRSASISAPQASSGRAMPSPPRSVPT